jgi:hypothetical protein
MKIDKTALKLNRTDQNNRFGQLTSSEIQGKRIANPLIGRREELGFCHKRPLPINWVLPGSSSRTNATSRSAYDSDEREAICQKKPEAPVTLWPGSTPHSRQRKRENSPPCHRVPTATRDCWRQLDTRSSRRCDSRVDPWWSRQPD